MKLLVVEDEASIRESLVDYFETKGHKVDAVASSEAGDEALADHDVVLLDLALPGRDGLQWLGELRARSQDVPVLIITARGEEEQRILGLQSGADDYIVKPFSVRELDARIQTVLRRVGETETDATVHIGAAVVDLKGHEIRVGEVRHRLLQKEAELLGFFVRHAGETLDRSRLLQEVWGYDSFPTTRTVDTHVLNLRKKLEPAPERPVHLITVHRVGYRLVL